VRGVIKYNYCTGPVTVLDICEGRTAAEVGEGVPEDMIVVSRTFITFLLKTIVSLLEQCRIRCELTVGMPKYVERNRQTVGPKTQATRADIKERHLK